MDGGLPAAWTTSAGQPRAFGVKNADFLPHVPTTRAAAEARKTGGNVFTFTPSLDAHPHAPMHAHA